MLGVRLDPRVLLAVFAVGVIWTSGFVITRVAPGHPAIAIGAAFDASISAAAAMYLIAVRRGHLPRWVVPLTITLGLTYARLVLAAGATKQVVLVTAGALEIMVMTLVVVRIRRARATWRTQRAAGAPPIVALTEAISSVGMPRRLAGAVALEVGLFGFLIVGWRRPARSPDVFTVHRVNGWMLYLGVFVFLTLVETGGLHMVLAHYDANTAAWIATILSLYSIAWLIGDAHALRHGGVTATATGLELRIGMRWRASIPWSIVRAAKRCDGTPDGAVNASVLGGNVVLELAEPVTVHGLFGLRRTGTQIALSIDEPERFLYVVGARDFHSVSEATKA